MKFLLMGAIFQTDKLIFFSMLRKNFFKAKDEVRHERNMSFAAVPISF